MPFNRHEHHQSSDRELLFFLLEEFSLLKEHVMALDLTKLNTALATLSGDVATLIAAVGAGTSAADQSAVDGAAASLDALSAKVTAALSGAAPPPPAPPAA